MTSDAIATRPAPTLGGVPLLDLSSLRLASPCPARWDEMEGDELRRFCGACKLHVYDVAHLTTQEALALITSKEGPRKCLRMRRRADGTVITRDCPVGAPRAARRRWFALVAIAGMGYSAWSWLAARHLAPPPPPPRAKQPAPQTFPFARPTEHDISGLDK